MKRTLIAVFALCLTSAYAQDDKLRMNQETSTDATVGEAQSAGATSNTYKQKSAIFAVDEFFEKSPCRALAFSPSGSAFASVWGNELKLNNTESGQVLTAVLDGKSVKKIFWKSNAFLCVQATNVSTDEIELTVFNASTLKPVATRSWKRSECHFPNMQSATTTTVQLEVLNISTGHYEPFLWDFEKNSCDPFETNEYGNDKQWYFLTADVRVKLMSKEDDQFLYLGGAKGTKKELNIKSLKNFQLLCAEDDFIAGFYENEQGHRSFVSGDFAIFQDEEKLADMKARYEKAAAVGAYSKGNFGFARLAGLQPSYIFGSANWEEAYKSTKRKYAEYLVYCVDGNDKSMQYVFALGKGNAFTKLVHFNGKTGAFTFLKEEPTTSGLTEITATPGVQSVTIDEQNNIGVFVVVNDPMPQDGMVTPLVIMLNDSEAKRFDRSYNSTVQALVSRGFRVVLLNVMGGLDYSSAAMIAKNEDETNDTYWERQVALAFKAVAQTYSPNAPASLLVTGHASKVFHSRPLAEAYTDFESLAAFGGFAELNRGVAKDWSCGKLGEITPEVNTVVTTVDQVIIPSVHKGSPYFIGLDNTSLGLLELKHEHRLTYPDNQNTYVYFNSDAYATGEHSKIDAVKSLIGFFEARYNMAPMK